MRALLAGVLALLALSCGSRTVPQRFHAWEEGLTLAYEDPRLPEPQRREARLQIRVGACREEGDAQLIRMDYSTLSGHFDTLLRARKGGICTWADGRATGLLLPEGFPATSRWESRGTRYEVIGWSVPQLPKELLPKDHPRTAVWVECTSPNGQRRRLCLLPDLGEVAAYQLVDGAWVCVNRLAERGFTDAPPRR